MFSETSTKPHRNHSQRAFTLVELMVVIAIISILMSIVLPGLRNARHRALDVRCKSTLRSISNASFAWSIDHYGMALIGQRGNPPGARFWMHLVSPYLGREVSDEIAMRRGFHCPVTDGTLWSWGYAINGRPGLPNDNRQNRDTPAAWTHVFMLDGIERASARLQFVDASEWHINNDILHVASPRHLLGREALHNVAFYDGSVASRDEEGVHAALLDP